MQAVSKRRAHLISIRAENRLTKRPHMLERSVTNHCGINEPVIDLVPEGDQNRS